ncbi:serine-type D-Ala-D-Ala carboxypeptidase [Spirabiliibacterium falconis]|uniref:serine-type D-Ala-D-Ala carboxypeptidase n=1 Tax=Spirabiliibacterium falconis TaxID=572023 RepID=UPI001AAD6504|nr:serine-type D-Ala-D-Ala carboxypeptidase [Spirabiliibacterium falconis]MBE2894221.1 serine-type D-Ala-D-Ala carboxypeptidase [Spirabiliibacterium falconis]
MIKLSTFICSLFSMGVAVAQISPQEFVSSLPQGASVALIAENLNQHQRIAQLNDDQLMLPASTQKIFTALAAKLILGDNFTFKTALLTTGKIQDGILQGDVIVKFSGDPTLTSGQLYQLLAQLKQRGVKRIAGNVWLDSTIFASHDRGLGWIWNDLTMCFNAPPSAASVDGNCFSVNLDASSNAGELVNVTIPAQFPVQVFSQVQIVEPKAAGFCNFDVSVSDNNRYTLKGCIARNAKPFGLSFAVQDPDSYAGSYIDSQLKRLGVQHSGVNVSLVPRQGNEIAVVESKPLPVLLKRMMKRSDNQIADSLFRRIGYAHYQRPVSFQQSAVALKTILSKQANIRFGNDQIADGSGLSRHNLVSPNTLLQALEYINAHDETLDLLSTFPIAGVDGTISGRGSMIAPPIQHNLIAKTGSLKGVYNLAGFITNARGEKIAFVQFVSNYVTGDLEQKTKRRPLVQFEKQFYTALFEE